jgi:hypothetical protein
MWLSRDASLINLSALPIQTQLDPTDLHATIKPDIIPAQALAMVYAEPAGESYFPGIDLFKK